MSNKTVILFFFSLIFISSQGQIYPSRQFTMNDGLPSNSVRTVFIDSRDWMWVGTDAGVCLFDGYRFNEFPGLEDIAGKKVWTIAEDEQHRMWFGTYGDGIACFDGRKIKWFNDNTGLKINKIRTLYFISEYNEMIAGGDSGVAVFIDDSCYSYPLVFPGNRMSRVLNFLPEKDSIICICQGMQEMVYWLPENKTIVLESITSENIFYGTYATIISSNNQTFSSFGREKIRVSYQNQITEIKGIGQVMKFIEDPNGSIWAAVWDDNLTMSQVGGLYKITEDKIECYNKYLNRVPLIGYDILFDNQSDCLWFASDNGLIRIPGFAFSYFPPDYFGLKKMKVNSMLSDSKGCNWFLCDSSLIRMENGQVKLLTSENFLKLLPSYQFFKRFDGLAEDSRGAFYLNTNNGLFSMNPGMTHFQHIDQVIAGNILFDEHDTLFQSYDWWPAYIYYNVQNTNKVPTDSLLDQPGGVNVMKRIDEKTWYGCRHDGLFVYHNRRFFQANKQDYSLSRSINDITDDHSGNAIIAANNGEIYIMSFESGLFDLKYRLSKKDGLIGNSIKWLVCDSQGNLWAGTEMGLNLINLDSLYKKNRPVIQFITEEEGYFDLTGTKALLDKNGNIWISLMNGMMKFSPSLLRLTERSVSKVFISSIELFNKSFDWSKEYKTDPWTDIPVNCPEFTYDRNYLTFSFSNANRLNPQRDLYSYILEGLDTSWTAFERKHATVYTSLKPGKYEFKIRSFNMSDSVNISDASFSFVIRPPWWRTWWFYSVCGLFWIIMIWIIILWRTRQVKVQERRRHEVQNQLSELRMQALQAQMNPHFTFNVLTSIQNTILDNEIDKALLYLSDVSSLIRKTLENASKKRISLDQEISYLESYLKLEKLRFGEKLNTAIEIDPALNTGDIQIPPMLIQPLVENAIKHGIAPKTGSGTVRLSFHIIKDQLLECCVEDDGIGFSATNEMIRQGNHEPKGLDLIRNRIRLLNEEKGGEQFKFEIKYHKESGLTEARLLISIHE